MSPAVDPLLAIADSEGGITLVSWSISEVLLWGNRAKSCLTPEV